MASVAGPIWQIVSLSLPSGFRVGNTFLQHDAGWKVGEDDKDTCRKGIFFVDLPDVELPHELWIFLKVLTMFRQLFTGAAFPLRAIEWWLSRDCCFSDFPGYVLQRALSEYRIGVPLADRVSLLAASKKPLDRSHSGFRRGRSFVRSSTSGGDRRVL